MNIAFVCQIYPFPTDGGIESVTDSLARQFVRDGHNCYCIIYGLLPSQTVPENTFPFSDIFLLTTHPEQEPSDCGRFLMDNGIDIIINQTYMNRYTTHFFRQMFEMGNIRFYTVFHSSPGFDFSFDRIFDQRKGFLSKIKPLAKWEQRRRKNKEIRGHHRNNLRLSDKYVLLSDRFRDKFIRDYKVHPEFRHKISAINNPLRFSETFDKKNIADKKQQVLIVTRLEEHQKRIGLALKIWSSIELHEDFKGGGWELVIVGHGPDEEKYRKMIAETGLKSVSLVGKKDDPRPFYKDASVFMMTSAFEGFPMTIGEALCHGAVPIVFDTFHALHDMIRDGSNGFIIPEGEIDQYSTLLQKLMRDTQLRQEMAANGIDSIEQFSPQAIASQWYKLFSEPR